VRLDFFAITGLEKVPDSTTICRYRNLLVERYLLDTLIAQVNSQLEAQGCQVEKSKGCGCDPNPVCSPCCYNLRSGLHDARKTRAVKGSGCHLDLTRVYFGYKGFMVTGRGGWICGPHVHMTPANKAEVIELDPILEKAPIWGRLYADKGYASCADKQLLKESKIKNGILGKSRSQQALTAAHNV